MKKEERRKKKEKVVTLERSLYYMPAVTKLKKKRDI